jgi:hypothetical protein
MAVQWALSALLPALKSRLKAYADTAAEDAALAAKELQRRLIAAAVALVGALMCLMLASAWIVGVTWNTPWRNPVLGTMVGVFLSCAFIGAALAARPFGSGQQPFARLWGELRKDESLLGGLNGPDGQVGGTFPRSTVMRLLLDLTGFARRTP